MNTTVTNLGEQRYPGEEHQEGKKSSEEDQTGSCKSKVNDDDEA
jgi:hypothetical protein